MKRSLMMHMSALVTTVVVRFLVLGNHVVFYHCMLLPTTMIEGFSLNNNPTTLSSIQQHPLSFFSRGRSSSSSPPVRLFERSSSTTTSSQSSSSYFFKPLTEEGAFSALVIDGDENDYNDRKVPVDHGTKGVEGSLLRPSLQSWKRFVTSTMLALSVILSTTTTTAVPQLPTIAFSTSSVAWAFTSPGQFLVDDVWKEVSRQYYDPTYGGMGEVGWKYQRTVALDKVGQFGPDDDDIDRVYTVIRSMLSTLGDPYTRFLTPEQYEALTSTYGPSESGSSSRQPLSSSSGGIGVQLIADNTGTTGAGGDSTASGEGLVVVVNTVPKGPASNSGILSGDAIRSIDGIDMKGATAEAVAAKCRGEKGTTVHLEIERTVEGDGGRRTTTVQTFSITRSPLSVTPVVESSMVTSSKTGTRLGIVKINTFTQETEQKVREGLERLVSDIGSSSSSSSSSSKGTNGPPSAIVVDLRGNMGGYMPGGVDVAKLFLPARARIISEVDRTGRATIFINDGVGTTDTNIPLYVLVDGKTASASEIFTAAIQDNQRGTVVGPGRTFGKGRIQNVQPLSSGSGIAITKAKYLSPNGKDIQNVGITPDIESKTCTPADTAVKCLEAII